MKTKLSWQTIRDYVVLFIGATIQAVCMVLFLIPAQLAAGGVSGAAQIINSFTGFPIGVMVLVANIPLFVMGWKWLGGQRFLARTVFASVCYSLLLDGLTFALPRGGLTDDPVLNALYGGVLGGIGAGLVIRAKGTTGGTDILARLLARRYAVPLSQSYMYTDAVVVVLAGLAFSWTRALYALLALYIGGAAAEVTSEGRDIVRVATIITDKPEVVSETILGELKRGVTGWPGQGRFTGQIKEILFCVVSRSEVPQLKTIIHEADPKAFVVIGHAHEALGEGFKPLTE